MRGLSGFKVSLGERSIWVRGMSGICMQTQELHDHTQMKTRRRRKKTQTHTPKGGRQRKRGESAGVRRSLKGLIISLLLISLARSCAPPLLIGETIGETISASPLSGTYGIA